MCVCACMYVCVYVYVCVCLCVCVIISLLITASLVRCGGLRALVDVALMDQLRDGEDLPQHDAPSRSLRGKKRSSSNARVEESAEDEGEEENGPAPSAHALLVRLLCKCCDSSNPSTRRSCTYN